ncbi:MAG TPA: polysaccharide deacetylase family protein [Candidatus Paceibacterota bacterium]
MKNPVYALGMLILIALMCYAWGHINIQKGLSLVSLDMEWAAVEKALQNLSEEKPVPGSIKVPIFIYHHVRPYVRGESILQDQFDVTPELLEQHLKYLAEHGYTTISPDELVRYATLGTTSPTIKPVFLTFDDGWRNQYAYAFPLLKKYRMTATFYVYTDPIGNKIYLTWDQLREMDQAGMTIASHTQSHPYFKTLALDKVTQEVTASKKILERELGKPVIHFASPYGSMDDDKMNILREAGYATGRTTYKGIYHHKDSLLKLRGILVSDRIQDFIDVLER